MFLFRQIVCVVFVLGVTYFEEINGIECNLCVGSSTSDCAKDVADSMVVRECMPITLHPRHHRHPHHHRHHHHHHDDNDVETTTAAYVVSNNVDVDESVTTSSPIEGQNVEGAENEREYNLTTMAPLPVEIKLDVNCVYIKVKETNETSSFVTRGCGYIQPKKDLCKLIKKLNKNLVECKTCTTDRCN